MTGSARGQCLFIFQISFGVMFYTLQRLLNNWSVLRMRPPLGSGGMINILTCFWFEVDGTWLCLSLVFMATRLMFLFQHDGKFEVLETQISSRLSTVPNPHLV